jgi:hypothetical protein
VLTTAKKEPVTNTNNNNNNNNNNNIIRYTVVKKGEILKCKDLKKSVFFLIFGFWRRVDMLVDADISEKHTLSIFQG